MLGIFKSLDEENEFLWININAINLSHKTASFLIYACPGKISVLEEYDAKT